mmetsp:Transcript_16204/g.50960  ORF Transcript_16204/g.50960 Transcript_16204/m.50960 type:complete len:370 (-) Transcript_16204:98-1207(-)
MPRGPGVPHPPGPVLCPRCECPGLRPPAAGGGDPCALAGTFSVEELLRKGFSVQPGFLPKEHVEQLLSIWSKVPFDSVTNPGANGGFQNNGRKELGNTGTEVLRVVPGLVDKMQSIIRRVEEGSDIKILDEEGQFEVGQNFLTTDSRQAAPLMEPWHQDFEAALFHQTVHDVLAFYVMLDKPSPREAGLQVVPFDILRERSPELLRVLQRPAHDATGGGCNFKETSAGGQRRTVVTDLFTDRQLTLNFTLDRLACTPELRPGDLLVYHGPAIHRTQPHKSWRTSLNMWVHPRRPKSVGKLLQGGYIKYYYMSQNVGRHLADFKSSFAHLRASAGLRLGWKARQLLRPVRERIDRLVGGFGAWPAMAAPC